MRWSCLTWSGLAAMLLAAPSWLQAQSSPPSEVNVETFDCRTLAAADERDSPPPAAALFERSLWASHCYLFDARAVRISADGVRTLALSHGVEAGIETESARFLDGPPLTIEKRGNVGERARRGLLDFSAGMPPGGLVEQVGQQYRLQPADLERVAGRPAWRLDIEPEDALRYGYRLWLDRQTSLPLKREIIGVDGRILETFQITELQSPSLYQGALRLDDGGEPSASPWQPDWLPSGFEAQPTPPDGPGKTARVEHRLYSDGLASISLFVEPVAEDRRPLLSGMHRLGISYAAVRHVMRQGRPMQILVLGEAPPEVLARIAARVTWHEGVDGEQSSRDSDEAGS
ncbi:MucB/RseB C-terminal domain-containing protein [Salinicola avicenniae]|uniref:MucB/RseB C-terminal domain-containing protein n=1 Tax=Salinicola avicenniae TaxID=2916836 RepID=UPI0020732410|nr:MULTISPECIES: MucB/RseB C-terminal domain-containing protein [unclassified Salinicola]